MNPTKALLEFSYVHLTVSAKQSSLSRLVALKFGFFVLNAAVWTVTMTGLCYSCVEVENGMLTENTRDSVPGLSLLSPPLDKWKIASPNLN